MPLPLETEVCFWLPVYNNSNGSSSVDMRNGKTALCGKCDGTPEKAAELGCLFFTLPRRFQSPRNGQGSPKGRQR